MRFLSTFSLCRLFSLLFLFLSYFTSCSDEFNLLKDEVSLSGDYEEVVVVYSNICPQSELNYIRINRVFLVENFYDANNDPNSIYYSPDEINVLAYKLDGSDTIAMYSFKDTLISKDDNGQFTTEMVPAFYSRSKILNEDDDNKDFAIDIKTLNRHVTAKTNLLAQPALINYDDYTTRFNFSDTYNTIIMKVPKNTQVASIIATCNFIEFRSFDDQIDTVSISFTFTVGEIFYKYPIVANTTKSYRMYNNSFFSNLISSIEKNGDNENTLKRKIGKIYFSAVVANKDMVLFNQLSQSLNTGFHDNLNTYSNIEDGFGFLVSHSKKHSKILQFTYEAKDTIVNRLGEHYLFVR
jgi:hypothetical protein